MSGTKKSPDSVDVFVGSRVRMRRMMLGMSQEKLGNELGVTFQQVQKYEKGTNRIGASRLLKISVVLKVKVEFLFEGAPGSSNETSGDDALDTQRLLSGALSIDMLKAFNQLPHHTQRSLLNVAIAAVETGQSTAKAA